MYYFFLGLGLLIRILLIPVPGFKADMAFWKGWGLAVADKGIVWLVNNTNYNYPPAFAYILWLINKIYALIKNPYEIGSYWLDTNVLYLFLVKAITIIADLIIVWLIIKIVQITVNPKSKIPVTKLGIGHLLGLFYFLNPAVIYDGVVWGQVDQFGLMFLIGTFYLILIRKATLASIVFTVGWLMKFQNIIFIPLVYLFIWRKYSFEEMVNSLKISMLTFVIVILPFFLGKQMEAIIRLLTINSDWFPWYSLNSFNIWWILSGLKGMQLTDKHLALGIISAKQLGFILFSFSYFIATVHLFFAKKENSPRHFVESSALVVFSFFHILTQSHERYLFPLIGLLPIMFLFIVRDRFINRDGSISKSQLASSKQNLWGLAFGILVSILFFLNTYLSLGWNYPDQVIPRFTREGTIGLSFWISIFQIALFAGFFVWLMRSINHIRLIGFTGIVLLFFLLFKNLDYIQRKAISLTDFKPIGYRQDYLVPVYNKTVESARGVKFWNRPSVNYFFYEKAIGSHADSEITYHLNRSFSKFSADFGVDTEGDKSASVYFSVLGDGRELFKSGVKGRFDSPSSTSVDVKGINYLTLKITKAGESNFGAHADWLNPLIIR